MQSNTPNQPDTVDNPAVIARIVQERCRERFGDRWDDTFSPTIQQAHQEQADILELYRQSRAQNEAARQEIHQKRQPDTDAITQAEIAKAIAEKEYLALQEHLRQLRNIIAYNDLQYIPLPRANYPGQRPITATLLEKEQRDVLPKVPTLELSPAPPGVLDTLEDTEPRKVVVPEKS